MRKAVLLLILFAVACRKEQPVATGDHGLSKPKPATQTGTGTATAPPAAARPDAGSTMPAYTADLLGGGTFDATAEKGSVVLINLWATWCGPCRAEIPDLEKLHQEYGPRGFKVVGVSVDEGGKADVEPFLVDYKITYPIALDPTGRLANILQTDILPTSIIVDRQGTIVWRSPGTIQRNDPKVKAAIENALGS